MAKQLLYIVFLIFIFSIDIFSKNLSTIDNKIEKTLFNFMVNNKIHDLSFSVSKNKKIVYSNYFEYSKKKIKTNSTQPYRFRIASLSKSFTAAAIMQLVQNGKLSFEDKVFGGKCIQFHHNKKTCLKYQKGIFDNDYQTKYEKSIIPNNSKIYEIKLINLLEHTTGTWNKIKGYAGDPMGYKENLDLQNLIKFVLKNTHNSSSNKNKKNIWLIPDMDTKFLYSNFGYSLLGRIIEKKSNLSYGQYIQKNILKKLNINTMYLAGDGKKENEVVYYGTKTTPYPDHIVRRYDAHGGWTATSEDLVKFGMQFNENLYPIKNKLGLDKKSMKLLKTPSSPLAKKHNYAKGFSLYLKDHSGWGHNGKLPGSLAYLRCNPKNNICYSAIINTDIDKKTAKKFKKLLQHITYNNF